MVCEFADMGMIWATNKFGTTVTKLLLQTSGWASGLLIKWGTKYMSTVCISHIDVYCLYAVFKLKPAKHSKFMRGTYSKASSIFTSVLASISPAPLPSEVPWQPVLIGPTFLSCFNFQPSTLSFQATLPNPCELNSLDAFAEGKGEIQMWVLMLKWNRKIHSIYIFWERNLRDWLTSVYGSGCTRFPPPPPPGDGIVRRSGEATGNSPESCKTNA